MSELSRNALLNRAEAANRLERLGLQAVVNDLPAKEYDEFSAFILAALRGQLDNQQAASSETRATDQYVEAMEAELRLYRRGLRIVFDGPHSHESGRFVEVEDASGKSVNAGAWRHRPDGLWELVLGEAK